MSSHLRFFFKVEVLPLAHRCTSLFFFCIFVCYILLHMVRPWLTLSGQGVESPWVFCLSVELQAAQEEGWIRREPMGCKLCQSLQSDWPLPFSVLLEHEWRRRAGAVPTLTALSKRTGQKPWGVSWQRLRLERFKGLIPILYGLVSQLRGTSGPSRAHL